MSDIAGTREAALAEKKICRFCLSEQKLASIFAENTRVKTTANLPLQIMAITAIEVGSGDGMPGYICLDCRLLFEHCYRFKQMCKRAETLLRQYPLTGTWPAPLDKPRAPMISGQASAAAAAKRDAPAPAPAPAPIVVEVQPKKLLNTMVKSNQVIIETVEILETSLLNKRKAPMASSTPMAERSQAYQLKVDTNQELSMDDVHSMLEDMANELDEMEPLQAEPTPQASPNKPKVLNKSSIRILNKGPAATLEPRIATPQITRDESGNVAVVTEILDPSHTAAPDDLVKNAEQVPTNVFPCPDCERSFPLQQLLDIHRVNHTRKRSFQCPECYKSFFSKYDLAKHNFIHTGEKPFKCSVCEKAFTRKALLHRHERSHTDIPKFICVYCERPFISREEMEKHAERHTKKRPFSCGVCGKAFAFKQGLERHEVVHQSNLPFPCQHCPRSFPTSCKLARHLVAHAGKRVYPCKYCPKSYLLSHHLSRHMRMHKQATADSSFVCSDCRETFTSYDSLLDHSTIHASMSLKCPLCREPIDDIDGVEVHIQLHRDSERFACEFCDHIFLSQAKAQKHIEDDHVVDMVPYQKEDEGEEEGEDAETEQLETAEREAQEFEVKEELLEEFLDDDDDLNDSDSSFVPPPKQRKTSPAKGRAVEVSAGEKRQTRSQDVKVAKPAAKKEAKVPAKQGRFVVKNGKWQKPTK